MTNTVDTDGQLAAGELIPSVSIEALLRRRDAAIERALQAVALLREGECIAKEGGFGFLEIAMTRRYGSQVEQRLCGEVTDDRDTDSLIRREIDRSAWALLMHESGLRSVMNAETRKRWDEQIAGKDVPELTRDNIAATFAQLHAQRGEMLEDGVVSVFRSLSWDYKTNHPAYLGHRIVLKYVLHSPWSGSRYGSPNHRSTDQLDDLERVISLLHGKPEADHRHGWFIRISEAIHKDGIAESEAMHVRVFKNGNGHVTFKDLKAVERLNAVIAKRYPGVLPAPRESRRRP